MAKYHQGFFKPSNPQKYKGDPTKIVYRSSWEARVMRYFDKHPDIAEWSSEEIFVPYISPLDNRVHRYFPDFIIRTINNKTIMIEVKPHSQTLAPIKGKKKDKTFLYEVKNYGINSAKWKYAREYCKKKGWGFEILTEKELPI